MPQQPLVIQGVLIIGLHDKKPRSDNRQTSQGRHPCPWQDSNPQPQKASGLSPTH